MNEQEKKLQTNTISAECSTHIHEMGISRARLECREMHTLGQQAHRRQLTVGITVPCREQATGVTQLLCFNPHQPCLEYGIGVGLRNIRAK